MRGWNETNNSRSSYSGKTYIITAWPVKHGVYQLTESGEIIVQQLAFQSVGHCFVDTEYSQSVIKQPLTQSFRQFVTHYICKSFSLPVSQSLGHPVYQVLRKAVSLSVRQWVSHSVRRSVPHLVTQSVGKAQLHPSPLSSFPSTSRFRIPHDEIM